MRLRRDFGEMLSAELLALTGGLFGGFMLAYITNRLELVPGLLILLPGFLEMRGSISGTLSGRLSSGLFVGAMKAHFGKNKILMGNIAASFVLGIAVSLILGALAYAVSAYAFGLPDMRIMLIALIAGALSNAIEIPLTVYANFLIFRRGNDPNNIMGPYVTTTGDVVSIVSLMIAVAVV